MRSALVALLFLLLALPASAQPLINSVSRLGPSACSTGQVVEVRAIGTPGGRAFLDVPGVARNVPMREYAPGTYVGGFRIVPGSEISNAPIEVRLETAEGRVSARSVDTLTVVDNGYAVPISTALVPVAVSRTEVALPAAETLPLTLSAPPAGQMVGRDFVVSGRTKPFAEVTAQAVVARSSTVTTATAKGYADANGNFALPLHLTDSVTPARVDLTVHASDRFGPQASEIHYTIATGD
jgi:hypothetical protein